MATPIGTQVQGRYIIEGLLGQGGFSAVYMVRDRKIGGKRFALKVLKNQSGPERERFLFECEVLKRLQHPALPAVSHMFEDNKQTYMLMEYIDGLNLEKLRQQQGEQRFALSEVLPLLASVTSAVTYLHSQPIPVLHRDIKPANIIVQTESGKAVLVDFGIAKEYHPDTTTTAIRHCSAGYSAPEQYSGVGTDPRSDVYSLGATCYTLLVGTVPMDALQRTTIFVTKGKDPLRTITEFVPALPVSVANVIQRALSINAERRYTTVAEFWQALENAAKQPPVEPAQEVQKEQGIAFVEPERLSASRRRPLLIVISTLLVILLLIGGGISLSAFFMSGHTAVTAPVHHVVKKTVQATLSGQRELALRYEGTVHDLLTKATTQMALTQVRQDGQIVSGSFAGVQRNGTFSGVLDTSKHLFFTVEAADGQQALFFEGAIRSDGDLVGNYCSQDSAGQCVGNYGLWSVAPMMSLDTKQLPTGRSVPSR